MSIDPLKSAVISQALIATAREMGAKMVRSAYSTIIREANDASAGILDAEGNIVALAELIPIHLGSLGATFRPCKEATPVEDLEPGDFYITNDPYSGGQHTPDIFVFSPIFVDDEILGFAGTIAHHIDVGGGAPTLDIEAEEIFQEGLVIPPSRYNYERDWRYGNLKPLIAANIRMPELTIGDIEAQFAANAVAIRRVQDLCQRYGLKDVRTVMSGLQDYSERRLRKAIKSLPDGIYEGSDHLDDDGLGGDPLVVRARLTIKGDNLDIDFTGTSPQTRRPINSPIAATRSAAMSCVKMVLSGPDVPFNEGAIRPVNVEAPLGSFINPTRPAAVRARMLPSYRVYGAVMNALAKVAPEKCGAAGFDTTTLVVLSHFDGRRHRVSMDVMGGGFGATAQGDGCDAIDSPLSNCSNTPTEVQDMDFDHFRLVATGVIPDSGGHGAFRGGVGFFRSYEILKDDVFCAVYSDRFRFAPRGAEGGMPGMTGRCTIERGGEIREIEPKHTTTLRKGDVLTMQVGGGGGFGDPAARRDELIMRDRANGFVSAPHAPKAHRPESVYEKGRNSSAAINFTEEERRLRNDE
jgi:N-methylhydantoinase B